MTQNQIEKVTGIISESFGVTKKDLLSNKRSSKIALARHVLYRSLTHLGLNLSEAGRVVGKDHTTVRHGIQVYNNMCETDDIFKARVQGIRERIKQIAYEG